MVHSLSQETRKRISTIIEQAKLRISETNAVFSLAFILLYQKGLPQIKNSLISQTDYIYIIKMAYKMHLGINSW